jgi:methionyl-tRNA formyltransferase
MGCEQLHDKLADMGGRLVVEWLQQIEQGSAFNAEKQEEDKTCYAPLLKKEDGLINWQQAAAEIDRQVRALNPWPATYTHVNGKVLRIQKAVLLDGAHHAATGQVLNKDGDIACGHGSILRILEVKPENSKAMGFKDALNGKHFNIGDVFT